MPGEPKLRASIIVAGASAERPRLDLDLEVSDGITVVMGPSGAGKSTLLFALAGLLTPERGRIVLGERTLFDHESSTFVPPHRRRVALVFQSLALFPHLSAWQNVAYGLPAGPRKARRDRAVGWLERARVAHLADRRPETLSGGEAQRVAFARALASEPSALLLDEPFSAMDRSLRRELGQELRALVDRASLPTLLVTHDPIDAEELGARVIHLESGRLADAGSSGLHPDPIRRTPA